MNEFDAFQDDRGGGLGPETEHWPDAALDAPVVLLGPVIQVLALPDLKRLGLGSASHPNFSMASASSFQVGLAAVDGHQDGQAVARIGPPEEALRIFEIARPEEQEIDRGARFVDRPVEVHPLALHLDVGLIDVPFARHSIAGVRKNCQ